MRLPLIPIIVIILINLFVDSYIYRALKRRLKNLFVPRLQLWSAALLLVLIIVTISLPRRNCSNGMLMTIMWCLYTYFSVYISKYVFVIIDLIASIPKLFHKPPGLPSEFENYKIAQISDFHVGTYGEDTTYVAKVVERVNTLKPDLIVFTGDIVNSKTSELEPHVSPLSRLSAPDGVLSILGNHDYGDYSEWASPRSKQDNRDRMEILQKDMGWRLLKNETEILHMNNDSMAVIRYEYSIDSLGAYTCHADGDNGMVACQIPV